MAELDAELVCPTCDTQCQSLAQLKRHERKHSGVKPFSCEFCGKGFSQKGNLTVHVRTHTGLKPFQCDVCNKSFTTSSYLKYHRQLHDRPNSRLWVANRRGVDHPLSNPALSSLRRDRSASLSSFKEESEDGMAEQAAKRAKSMSPQPIPSSVATMRPNVFCLPTSLANNGMAHPMLAMGAQPMLLNMPTSMMPSATMATALPTPATGSQVGMQPTMLASQQQQQQQQMALYAMMAQYSAAAMMQSCMQAALQQQQQQQQASLARPTGNGPEA